MGMYGGLGISADHVDANFDDDSDEDENDDDHEDDNDDG